MDTPIVIAVVALVVVVAAAAVRVVPQSQAFVVQRAGRYHRTAGPGVTFVVPLLDRVRAKVDLREQVIRIPPTWVSAQDDLPVFVATVLHFRVSDAQAVAYAVADHHAALQQLATTTLGNLVAQLPREDVVAWSGGLGEGLRNVLNDAAARWGLRVDRAELTMQLTDAGHRGHTDA